MNPGCRPASGSSSSATRSSRKRLRSRALGAPAKAMRIPVQSRNCVGGRGARVEGSDCAPCRHDHQQPGVRGRLRLQGATAQQGRVIVDGEIRYKQMRGRDPEQWPVRIDGAHVGYISWQQYF